jgi:TonB family protein
MKTPAVLLGAAALALAASAAHAGPSELQRYAAHAKADAQNMLREARLDLEGRSVSVRARIDVNGHLTGLEVVRSSGSPSADLAVEAVLKRVVAKDPLFGLDDGAVIITVKGTPVVEAKAG